MHLQFQTEDNGNLYITDTKDLDWVRIENSEVVERGKLVPQGFGIYALSGKRDGLRTIGTYTIGIGQEVKIFLRANVPVKNFTMPAPINRVSFEILPADPNQIQHIIENMDQPQLPEAQDATPDASSGNPDPISPALGNIPDDLLEDSGPASSGSDDPFTE